MHLAVKNAIRVCLNFVEICIGNFDCYRMMKSFYFSLQHAFILTTI